MAAAAELSPRSSALLAAINQQIATQAQVTNGQLATLQGSFNTMQGVVNAMNTTVTNHTQRLDAMDVAMAQLRNNIENGDARSEAGSAVSAASARFNRAEPVRTRKIIVVGGFGEDTPKDQIVAAIFHLFSNLIQLFLQFFTNRPLPVCLAASKRPVKCDA